MNAILAGTGTHQGGRTCISTDFAELRVIAWLPAAWRSIYTNAMLLKLTLLSAKAVSLRIREQVII